MRAVHEGRVVRGRYRLQRVLSEGGMGVVLLAIDLQTGDPVAMKFVQEAFLGTSSMRRIFREARAVRRLTSRHVCRVLEVADPDEPDPYLVMEYLDGRDLFSIVASGPISVEDACEWLVQTCDAIADAHAHRVVHRDLKPHNLFLVVDEHGLPCVKVLDFGLSKILVRDVPSANDELTVAGSLVGSIEYASPEQVQASATLDERADIWSLGAVLYHLLSGRPAFAGDSVVRVFNAVVFEEPVPLHEARPEVPAALADVVMACLVKDVERRTPSAQALAEGLAPWVPERTRPILDRIASLGFFARQP